MTYQFIMEIVNTSIFIASLVGIGVALRILVKEIKATTQL